MEIRNLTNEQTTFNDTDWMILQEATGSYLTKKFTYDRIKDAIVAVAQSTLSSYFSPVGMVSPFAGMTAPAGWLMCDGSSLLRASYTDLVPVLIVSKGTCTISIASPGVVTLNTHGLITGDRVHLTTDGALPTGLSASTDYWVIYNDANTFWLATSLANAVAGTKINTSGTQSGTHTLYRSPYGIADATHFNVPDMTESYPVGIGTRGSGITAHDVFALGQFKDDQKQGSMPAGYSPNSGTPDGLLRLSITGYTNSTPVTAGKTSVDNGNGTPREGTVTRGKGFGVNYIIKY